MSRKKQPKQRSYVAYDMIQRSQKAGLHIDIKKEADKTACREPIDLEDWDEYNNEGSSSDISDGEGDEFSRCLISNTIFKKDEH